MPVYQFTILCLIAFIGICSVLLLIVRLLLPRHDYREETPAGFPDFDSHLEPLSIGVERQVSPTLAKSSEFRCGRVHRRERATLPCRRGDL